MWISLGKLINKKGQAYAGKLENARLSSNWSAVIKNIHPKAASYTQYKDLKKDTLYIRVEDAIWVGELEFYKEKLKKSLNEKRKDPVRDIKLVLD